MADYSAVYLPYDSAEFTPSSEIPALLQKMRYILQTRTWCFPEEARKLKVLLCWRVNWVVISLWCQTAECKCGKNNEWITAFKWLLHSFITVYEAVYADILQRKHSHSFSHHFLFDLLHASGFVLSINIFHSHKHSTLLPMCFLQYTLTTIIQNKLFMASAQLRYSAALHIQRLYQSCFNAFICNKKTSDFHTEKQKLCVLNSYNIPATVRSFWDTSHTSGGFST